MPRKQSKTVSEGNDSVPHHNEFGFGEPTMADLYRMLEENFDRQVDRMRSDFDQQDKKFSKLTEIIRAINQRLAGLQSSAATSRHGSRRRTRHEDSQAYGERRSRSSKARGYSSSSRVDHTPMRLTIFGDDSTEPPAPPIICRDEAPVDEGAEAPKPFLSPGKMRTTTTVGGLLPAGRASTATKTIFPHHLFFGASVRPKRYILVRRQQFRHTPRTNFFGKGRS